MVEILHSAIGSIITTTKAMCVLLSMLLHQLSKPPRENVILMQVVLGMTSPAACKLKAFSTDLVHFVLKVSVRNSSGSNGHCGLRANSVSQEEDGNISRYNSNDILLVDATVSPGTQAIGAECSHGQAGEHN